MLDSFNVKSDFIINWVEGPFSEAHWVSSEAIMSFEDPERIIKR